MMKIVLFALVCVAITQVHGSELDDAIKKAIEKLDSLSKTAQKSVESAKSDCTVIKGSIDLRTEYYIERSKDIQENATNALKEVAKKLTEKAKEGKNPEETIKCITKEEQSAISTMSTLTSKLEADLKKVQNDRVAKLSEKEKEVKKIEDELSERYKQGVADLKKCTDVEMVNHIFHKLEGDYTQVIINTEKLNEKILYEFGYFDSAARNLNEKYEKDIQAAKAQGTKKMNECMPKMA